MLMVSTYVAPSAIDGLGVFAGESVARGSLMWSLNPKFDISISREEIDGLRAASADLHLSLQLSASGTSGIRDRRLRQRAVHES